MKTILCLMALCATIIKTSAAETDITISASVKWNSLIPVALTGFTGEAAQVIRFDLEVLGFKIVPADQADYTITGKNDPNVSGRVLSKAGNPVLAVGFKDASERIQAHAFADEVIKKFRGPNQAISRNKIVYKQDAGQNKIIKYSDYDGNGSRALTDGNSLVAAPCVSKGRLYYCSYERRTPQIFGQSLSTGERIIVSNKPGLNTSPAVSPDGTRVAMVLSQTGSPDLWVADANGENPVQLTRKRNASSPCWSADGKSIYVILESPLPRLYRIPASGGEAQSISTVGVGNVYEPDCSPDGKWVVFTTQRGHGIFEIYMAPAQGGDAQFLVQGEDPVFAANSRTILFVRGGSGRTTLSLLDVPTKQIKDLPKLSGNCSQPAWVK